MRRRGARCWWCGGAARTPRAAARMRCGAPAVRPHGLLAPRPALPRVSPGKFKRAPSAPPPPPPSYFDEGADEVAFLNITGFRDCPLADLPMLGVLQVCCAGSAGPRGWMQTCMREHARSGPRMYAALQLVHARMARTRPPACIQRPARARYPHPPARPRNVRTHTGGKRARVRPADSWRGHQGHRGGRAHVQRTGGRV